MPAIAYVTLRGQWEFSDAVCVTLGFLTMLTFVASVMSLAAISINRFYIVCRPQEVARKYTKLMTALWFAGKRSYTLVFIEWHIVIAATANTRASGSRNAGRDRQCGTRPPWPAKFSKFDHWNGKISKFSPMHVGASKFVRGRKLPSVNRAGRKK